MNAKRTLLAVALLVPAAAPGQTLPETPRVAGAVETAILEIDVVVTDRDGRPVPGLGPRDFEVRIGGKPVSIENFYGRHAAPPPVPEPASTAPGTTDPPPSVGPAPPAALRPPRHLVLFLDRLHLVQKWKADATFEALRRTLRSTVTAPGDDAMIVTWDRSVRSVVPFTSDLAAIERVLAREERLCRQPLEEDATRRQLLDEAAWFESLPRSPVSSGVEVSQRAAAAEALARMRAKATALKAVFATLGGLPGRKIAVLVSHRFSELAGLEFSLSGRVRYGEIPADAREFNARGLVNAVVEAANANGVTLYTFFPAGWPDEAAVVTADASRSANPRIDDPVEGARGDMIVQNEAAALEPLAAETGGSFTLGYQEAPALAGRVVSDLESSYSLGVAAPGGKSGRSFSVDVRVRDRSLRVRARRSGTERTAAERVESRVLSNLFRPEPASPLGVSLAAAVAGKMKGRTAVSLSLRVPIARLARTPSSRGESGVFSVFVASAGADGSFTEVVRRRQPFEIPRADAGRAAAGQFTYDLPVLLRAEEARISVGVWDEVGREAGFLLVDVAGGKAALHR